MRHDTIADVVREMRNSAALVKHGTPAPPATFLDWADRLSAIADQGTAPGEVWVSLPGGGERWFPDILLHATEGDVPPYRYRQKLHVHGAPEPAPVEGMNP